MSLLHQFEHTDVLSHPADDLSKHKFSEILDAYLAHMVRGPVRYADPRFHDTEWWPHAQALRDEMDKRIEGVK